jgi:hypothetical protein
VPRRHRELWYSLAAIVATTALYVLAYLQAGRFPSASGLVGHGIGIVGFVLMLMTATLYSIRKLATDARWGSMEGWLRFHMVTGLVGPYMVLLHTAMRFQGLAGVAMLLTIVVVISGLVGRYIYTGVPRVVEGAEPDMSSLDRRFAGSDALVMASAAPVTASPERGTAAAAAGTATAVLESPSVVALGASPPGGDQPQETGGVPGRPLDQRLDRLAGRRRALATWRAIHVPLTWALFVTALVHVVAALYYAVR